MKLLEKKVPDVYAEFLDRNSAEKRIKGLASSASKEMTKPEKVLCCTVKTIVHLQETRSIFNLEDDDVTHLELGAVLMM